MKSMMLNEKSHMYFVNLEKAFEGVPRKVFEWATWKKKKPDAMARSVMCLYEGAKTRVRVNSELSEELEAKVGMHQGCVLSPFLFAVVVDFVSNLARERALSELLYGDDLVLMSETMVGLRNHFMRWKETFESKGLKVNLGKINFMVNGGITQDGLSRSKVDPCRVCSLRVMANSALCVHCGKWIHSRCARAKR